MSVKDAVIEMIRALPDGATWDDIVAEGETHFGGLVEAGEWSDEFKATLARRAEELRTGKVKGVPAEEVMARLKAKYAP